MSLEKIILDELQKFKDNGIDISNVSLHSTYIQITIVIDKSLVEFKVDLNDGYQYEILSIVCEGHKCDHKHYINQYKSLVEMVIAHIMPVIINLISEYKNSPKGIERREKEAKIKESKLEKKKLELSAKEQILNFQEQAFEFESQTFEDELIQEEKQKFRASSSKISHILTCSGITIAIGLVLVLVVSRISENTVDDVEIDEGIQSQDQTYSDIVADLRENFERPINIDNGVQDIILGVGEFVVGEQINPGRYIITPVGYGNLVVNRGDALVITEMIGSDGQGVPSVTVSLVNGDVIEVSGVENVVFTKVTSGSSSYNSN